MHPRSCFTLLLVGVALAVAPAASLSAADAVQRNSGNQGVGSIAGLVTSASTGNTLEGAEVRIPAWNRQVLTDASGRFTFTGLPLGQAEITVSYTGLLASRRTVPVATGGQPLHTFELSAPDIIMLDKFTVATEREGNALAVSNQRNAPNLKNSIAMDAFGKMPNMGVGELLMRLPGVAAEYDGEGNAQRISVRGLPPGLTSTTIDGSPAFRGNGARAISYQEMTGAIYEQVELTKGHTPDQTANSLGGSVNLKTRSPLSMREKRRVGFNLSGRWVPSFLEHGSERREHPFDGIINLSYQEAFDVRGGQRNLGLSVSLFRGENINSGNREVYNYQNTAAAEAFIHDYRSITHIVNRQNTAANIKLEYRPTAASKYFLGVSFTQGDNPATDQSQIRFFTAQTVATLGPDGQPTGTGTILPGYTQTRTQVRGLAASSVELTNSHQTFNTKTPSVFVAAEHKLDRWEIDYKVAHTSMHIDRGAGGNGSGGTLVMRAPNVGWIIDRQDPASPRFVQTEGRSIYDVGSYNTGVTFTIRDEIEQSWAFNSDLNAAYRLPSQWPTTLKSGLAFEQRKNNRTVQNNAQWTRVAGAPPLPNTPLFVTTFDERQGGRMPVVDARAANRQLADASLWTDNLNYREVQKLSGNKSATEEVAAAYTMVRTKVDRLGVLAGIRVERTEVTGQGNVRRRPATVAEIPDPVARARYDWGVVQKNAGRYTRSFPSIHFTYNLTEELKARASWSTSFGRPDFSALVPNATINDTAQTVTVANPALGPQYAKNIDLSVEYFFRPAGLFTLGYFEKSISDYILLSDIGLVAAGQDNGYSGDYSGYRIFSRTNAGAAEVKGWEVDYRQQFTFLPGVLKGVELAANYTILQTQGDFGGTSVTRNKEVAGFVPRTGNVSLVYNYLRFGTRVNFSYASDYLRSFSADPTARFYIRELKTVNWSVSYRWRPSVTVSCDLTNVLAARRGAYQYAPGRINEIYIPGQMLSVGISGSF